MTQTLTESSGSPPRPPLDEITKRTLQAKNSSGSCWIVIDELVYDVTSFHHPGGNDRLFDLAGKDATSAFKAIHRDSDAAHRQMKKLLVGRLVPDGEAKSAEVDKVEVPEPPASDRRKLRAGSNHRLLREGEHLWSTRRRGFLPARDPLLTLGEPYTVLLELMDRMPSALADGTFRMHVDAEEARLRRILPAVETETSLDVLERVHGLYGYIGKGYVHTSPGVSSGSGADVPRSVPAHLSTVWLAVSEKLGRHPTIDYSDCVLYNWVRIDPASAITPENIRLLNRFTGLMDEEWFLKTHVIIESEASSVVSAIYDACNAIRNADKDRLLAMLAVLEQAMSHVASNCLWIMFERQEDDGYLCEPDLFYHRFRPYISTWTALFEGHYENDEKLVKLREELQLIERLSSSASGLPDLKAHREHLTASIAALQKRKRMAGPSGAMSTILPLCDAFLDVQMSSPMLGRMLATFEEYMPSTHRSFLDEVRQVSAAPFIKQLVADNDEQAATLVDHFNAVVRRVLDFRWRHLSYIEQYVLKPSGESNARGTGGTPAFSYLNQHINDTEKAMLQLPEGRLLRGFSQAKLVADKKDSLGADSPMLSPFLDMSDTEAIADFELDDDPERELRLWAVTHQNGLLPTSPPMEPAELPYSWHPVRTLLHQLPSACVPPATFHDKARAAASSFPTSIDELHTHPMLERARSLLAYIVAGWSAASAHAPHHPHRDDGSTTNGQRRPPPPPPPPERIGHLLDLLCAKIGRAPRLGLADLTLYNWVNGSPTADRAELLLTAGPSLASSRSASFQGPTSPSRTASYGDCPFDHGETTGSSERSEWREVGPSDGEGGSGEGGSGEGGSGEGALAPPEPPSNGSGTTLKVHVPQQRRGSKATSLRPQLQSMGSVSPIQRFICVEEEDWFCRLHVTLAAESGGVMRSVRRCLHASSTAEQVSALQGLEKAIEVLVRVHYAAGIGQPIGADVPMVRPALLMRRLHRFLPFVPEMGVNLTDQRAARIYCFTGIDQSCLMHLLGVPRGGHTITRFRTWMESEDAAELPSEHRSFLNDIMQRRSMREDVEHAVGVKVLSVPELARLELAHNSCIDMLLRYFSRRIELVRAMLGEDSLRGCYDIERANIQSARLRLLVERREMVGPQEGLDTRAKFYKRDPGERGV